MTVATGLTLGKIEFAQSLAPTREEIDGALRFVRSAIEGLPTPQDRRARIADPRAALDILLDQRRITPGEHEAGKFFGNCGTSGGRAAMLLYRHLIEQLEAVEIDLPGLVSAVCIEHKCPRTIPGLERLRRGLRLIGESRDELDSEMDLPGFAEKARYGH